MIYRIKKDFDAPTGSIAAGTEKSEAEWMEIFHFRQGVCRARSDWFEEVEHFCSRCSSKISDRWEQSVSKGDIDITVCSQSQDVLWTPQNAHLYFNHPALINHDHQRIQLSWGHNKRYRLCWSCHREFVGHIGKFLIEQK